jgi:magnesium chelatase family protein
MKIYSATLFGVTPLLVEVEIDLSGGLPFFQIVGLPDVILRESKTRVKSAIIQAGYDFPYDSRLVLNLSPSKIRKEGSAFELALAVRILVSSEQIKPYAEPLIFLGELALDGTVRSIQEVEALAFAADDLTGFSERAIIFVPLLDASKLKQRSNHLVIGLNHISELKGSGLTTLIQNAQASELKKSPTKKSHIRKNSCDFNEALSRLSEIKLSKFWARHLEIAVVGRHSYLLCGPPGAGKTFFSETLSSFYKALRLSQNENSKNALDAIFNRSEGELPWAAPHHSVTSAGLLGGGLIPQPGALTRAHGGVLFLDELLEFSPHVLDALREPLEKKQVEIFRSGGAIKFPSDVQLIAATNPCRCGYWQHPWISCTCMPTHREQYQSKISGPFFDRFEVRVFSQPAMVDEETITALEVFEKIKRLLKTPFALISDDDFHFKTLARKLGSRRLMENMKRVAQTLARIDAAYGNTEAQNSESENGKPENRRPDKGKPENRRGENGKCQISARHYTEAFSYQSLKCLEKRSFLST